MRAAVALIATLFLIAGKSDGDAEGEIVSSASASASGIGDRLIVNAIRHYEMPTNVWNATTTYDYSAVTGQCDPNMGVEYAYQGATTAAYPISLFFTAAGQLSGIAVTAFSAPQSGSQLQYWTQLGNGNYQLQVAFRNDTNAMCNPGKQQPDLIGNVVLVAPGVNGGMNIPLTASDAQEAMWTNGSCITSMGRHWAYDLGSAPDMSWESGQWFENQ